VRQREDLPGQGVEHIGVGLIEVAKPVLLEVAERVGFGGGEVGRGEPGGASAILSSLISGG
jgi:hypothetical protein